MKQVNEFLSPISINLQNGDGKPVLYITTDANRNTLHLIFSNNSGKALFFKGGTPISETEISTDGPAAFYLTLSLNDKENWKNACWHTPGWQHQFFPDLNNWCLCPEKDVSLGNGDTLTFTIEQIAVQGNAGTKANLEIDFYNFTEAATMQTLGLPVLLEDLPNPALQDLKLDVWLQNNNTILVSPETENPITNTLYLSIANPSPDHPLVAQTTRWGASPPIFSLFFAYSDPPGYGALCSVQSAAGLNVQETADAGGTWKVTKNTTNPSWDLYPQDHNILGTGQDAAVSFQISNIVSSLKAGVSLLYLHYANIPGYNPGLITLPIQKKTPVIGINSFAADTHILVLGETVYLSWVSEGVDFVELAYQQAGKKITLNSKGKNPAIQLSQQGFSSSPTKDTVYHLRAYNDSGELINAMQVPINVNQPAAKIVNFTASKTFVPIKNGKGQVTFVWQVENAATVYLNGELQKNTTSIEIIERAKTFTLKAIGHQNRASENPSQAEANIQIRAYEKIAEVGPPASFDVKKLEMAGLDSAFQSGNTLVACYPFYNKASKRTRFLSLVWDLSNLQAAFKQTLDGPLNAVTDQGKTIIRGASLAAKAEDIISIYKDQNGTFSLQQKLDVDRNLTLNNYFPIHEGQQIYISMQVNRDNPCFFSIVEKEGTYTQAQVINLKKESLLYVSPDGQYLITTTQMSQVDEIKLYKQIGTAYQLAKTVKLLNYYYYYNLGQFMGGKPIFSSRYWCFASLKQLIVLDLETFQQYEIAGLGLYMDSKLNLEVSNDGQFVYVMGGTDPENGPYPTRLIVFEMKLSDQQVSGSLLGTVPLQRTFDYGIAAKGNDLLYILNPQAGIDTYKFY